MTDDPAAELAALATRIRQCTNCRLSGGRTQAVPGDGPIPAQVMFVGEGPGYHEDRQGIPFVGAAGQLLNELLVGAGLSRAKVYVTNIVKCRPPENRDPLPDEIEACRPYLEEQIALYRRMTGEQRLGIALSLHELACDVAREGIRSRHPNADAAEVERQLRSRLALLLRPRQRPSGEPFD